MARSDEVQAPTLRFLRLPEVIEKTGLSSVSIWRLEAAGEFPKKRRLAGRLIGYRSDEIDAWIESRERVED